ncbi:helix-turn-helix domain-containing protein [Pseudoroseomonas ludipueritiae]|uniref:Helix-turn-helix transcriptional regulator n=1 Tax=Pseudoroseomonas ludipueritiae TaxID=198093 RepID=A0ABR7R4Y4_9PROT|nr:helix-turn-helix transcriptional regulator [Pseudoroseomonas ludipueritiae]MBC9176793.1 helix-turn-helix transcriptional regulator [Pseudoroseomonas ludipueritiae]
MRHLYAESRQKRKHDFYRSRLGGKLAAEQNLLMAEKKSGLSKEAKAMQHNLKLWRNFKGYTLRALAEQTGNPVSTLSSWENGTRALDLDDLRDLAAFYGVHPAALLMTPEVGPGAVTRMQQAASIIQDMSDKVATTWLVMGKLSADYPGDPDPEGRRQEAGKEDGELDK